MDSANDASASSNEKIAKGLGAFAIFAFSQRESARQSSVWVAAGSSDHAHVSKERPSPCWNEAEKASRLSLC